MTWLLVRPQVIYAVIAPSVSRSDSHVLACPRLAVCGSPQGEALPGPPATFWGGSWGSCWGACQCWYLPSGSACPLSTWPLCPWVIQPGLLNVAALKSPWRPPLVEGTSRTRWPKLLGSLQECQGGLCRRAGRFCWAGSDAASPGGQR